MKKSLIIAFGSQVSGRTRTGSDFDFAVLSTKPKPLSLAERSKISFRLAKKLKINEDKIDLIDLNTASPILRYEVTQKGKLLEGDPFDFIRLKVRSWKIYQDTARFRRARETRLKKYVQGLHS